MLSEEQKQKVRNLSIKANTAMRALDDEFNQLASEFNLPAGVGVDLALDWLHDAVFNCNEKSVEEALAGFEKELNKNGNV